MPKAPAPREAQAPSASSFHLAPDLRIAAIRDGAIISTSKGVFRLADYSANRFISEVLPALYGAGPPSGSWHDLCPQLLDADAVRSGPSPLPFSPAAPGRQVALVPATPLLQHVRDHLARCGMVAGESIQNPAFIVADLSALDPEQSLHRARELHRAGCPSIAVWKRGDEVLYGPLAGPRTACWNCCRLRFSDSLACDAGVLLDDPATARVIADNILLAVRYPDIAAYGCVVIENGHGSSLHSVVPMPFCEVCGSPPALTAARLAPLTHSLHVPEQVRILADPRGGIVRRLFLFGGEDAEVSRMPLCASAVIARYNDGIRSHPEIRGEGKGATREEAVWSAIGEGVERYAASLWRASDLTHASFDELAGQAFDPRWLVLYDEEQYAQPDFPFAPFDPRRNIPWATGRWLDTGETVRVPALATYMNFPAARDEQFCQVSSNGLAAGATFEDAALRALYELIERDAFMLFWLSRRPALRVTEDGCDPVASQALREVERFGARTELYLIDAGAGLPTVVCIGLGDGRAWPGATIGLGTHADVDIALRRAVLEHGHCGSYIRRLMTEGRHADVRGREDVETGLDHALYYIHPEHVGALAAFRHAAGPPASLAELRRRYRDEATLPACVALLRQAGIRTAAVDVTSPDVALAPIRVVRAVGQYLHPIYFGTRNRRLKNPRLDRWLSGTAETEPHPLA